MILVGYTSKHGASAEIAERIAEVLMLARTTAEPKEIRGFREAIHPRDHHVFFGALDPSGLTFAERASQKLPAARAMMPEGDFRDWTEIEDWARSIAEEWTQPDAGQVEVDP